MDITSLIGTLLSSDSVSGVSKTTKASSNDVTSVLTAALPLLLNGAQQQAEDESTAESFASALLSHGKEDTSDLSSFLSNVDLADGAKIIGHLLGNDESAVKQIAKKSGTSAKTTSNVLAASAPLLMSLLGQSSGATSKKKSNAGGGIMLALAAGALLKNVDFGNVLGGLLDVSADEEEEEPAPKKTSSKKASPAKSSTKKTTSATKKKAVEEEDDAPSTAELLGDLLGSLLK